MKPIHRTACPTSDTPPRAQRHHTASTTIALLLSLASVGALPAQASDCHDLAPLEQRLDAMVGTVATQGASLLLVHENVEIARIHRSGYDASTVIPIASATKWLSGAVIMKLVDQGRLSLDDPIRNFRSDFTGAAADITIRQLFSHTSGMVTNDPVTNDRSLTMEQAVAHLATLPLANPPGTALAYGSPSMHVAGRIAEQVTGHGFEQLFQDLIGTPLGMTSTDYQGFGPTTNYLIAGGARSSLEDMGRFLEMIANDGMFRGQRILSETAVDTMLADQTRGARIVRTIHPDDRRYGIGVWRDRLDPNGAALEVSSPGGFGTWPFVDRERNSYGIVLVQSFLLFTRPQTEALLDEIRSQVRFAGLRCYGNATPACRGTVHLAGNSPASVGNAGFAIQGRGAPDNAMGALFFSAGAPTAADPTFGFDLWIDPLQVLAGEPLRSRPDGTFTLPIPLTGLSPSGPVFTQTIWLGTPSCSATGSAAASHALAITLR